MTTRQYRPSRLRRFILPGMTALFLGYFTWHAFHGEYGIVGRTRLESRTAQLNAELARLRDTRRELELRVSLMRPQSLDEDMVDERAREALNLAHPNDLTIFRPRGGVGLINQN